MTDTAVDRRRIALHEAAHAVVAIGQNLHMRYATIRPSSGIKRARTVNGCAEWAVSASLGHVIVDWPGAEADLGPYLLMTLAGPAAERRHFGNSLYDTQDIEDASPIVWIDVMHVDRLWTKQRDVDEAMPALHAKADRLVEADWLWIVRVADALEERIGLLSDEVLQLRPFAWARQ